MLVTSYYIKFNDFFCLKHKISIPTEIIGFSILGKLSIGPEMVFNDILFHIKVRNGFQLFFLQTLSDPLKKSLKITEM